MRRCRQRLLTAEFPLHVNQLADHQGAADERPGQVAQVGLVLLADEGRLALGKACRRV